MIFRQFAGINPLGEHAKRAADMAPPIPKHYGDKHRNKKSMWTEYDPRALNTNPRHPGGPERNIYGQKLVSCGKNPGSADGDKCDYTKWDNDPGRHQICVTKLPPHFSRKGNQGDWSEPETGREWCVCIWAYANWVLNHDEKDLPVKCDGVSEMVLASDYALKAWKMCGNHWEQCQ